MRYKTIAIWALLFAGLGVVNAVAYKVVELIVTNGTLWLWNDVVQSDVYRWRVVSLAAVLGLAYGIILWLLKETRLPEPETDPLHSAKTDDESAKSVVTLTSMFKGLAVGLSSLVAGASLGPEAALTAFSKSIGKWVAQKTASAPPTQLLVLASVGGLLVAFFGSLIPLAIPVLLLLQKGKLSPRRLGQSLSLLVPVLFTGVVSYATLWVIDRHQMGFGTLPTGTSWGWTDIPLALLLGILTAGLGWGLRHAVIFLWHIATRIQSLLVWLVASSVFGLGIGLLYLVGGPPVQFNGSTGSELLFHHAAEYGAWAIVVMIIIKLLVTAWSLATGYRGGLVFPSIFIGVATGLLAETVLGLSGPGVVIGTVAGIMSAMMGPVFALVMIAALVHFQLWPVTLAGVIGAFIGNLIIRLVSGKVYR